MSLQDRLQNATGDKYDVERLIGYGGMAGVYLARDTQLNRYVALKLISPGVVLDPRMVRRFFQEAQTMAQLSHRHIVPIYDINERDDLVYMVMRYVPGRTLAEVVADSGEPLEPDLVATWMAQIASALAHAHTRSIAVIHRDIKPSNILLDENGDALLTDFGIAKIQGESNLTRTGHLIGTPAYMSPEQVQGAELGPASDQYSLGTVAYELLAGVPPFKGPTLMVLQAHSSREAPPLEEARPECPQPLARVVQRMLAKSPDDRWPSMATLSAEFGRVIRAPVTPGILVTWAKRVHKVMIPDSPDAVTLGTKERLEARILDQDGRPLDGRRVRWASTNEQVIQISPDGVVAGTGVGSAMIVARSGNAVTTLEVKVLPPSVSQIVVSPPSVEMATGEVRRLDVTCYSRAGEVVDAATRFRSSAPDVVTVQEDGTIAGITPGEATITVSAGGVDQGVAVRVEAAAVVSLTPAIDQVDLTVGDETRIAVTAVGQDGRPQPDSAVWWSSSNPDVVTVTGDGWVRAVYPGEAVLTASAGPTSARVHVAVRGAAHPAGESDRGSMAGAATAVPEATGFFRPENFEVAPAPPAPPASPPGASGPPPRGAREQGPPVHAPARPPVGGDPAPGAGPAQVSWSNPTVRLAALGLLGLIVGFGLFRAFSGGGQGGALQVSLVPGDTTVSVGEAFQARVSSSRELVAEAIQWTSSDNSVITVSATGLARARTPGTAEISVRGSNLASAATMIVNVVPAESGNVAMILGPTEVVVGSGAATYRVQSPEGEPQNGDVNWIVDREDLATVSSRGELTPRAAGTVRLTALFDGEALVFPLEILAAPEVPVVYRDIQIARVPTRVTRGTLIQPQAALVDDRGRSQASSSVSWTSSNPAVLRQTGPASFEAAATGQAALEVYSASAGLRRSTTVTVVAPEQRAPDPVEPDPDPVEPDPDPVPSQLRIGPRDVSFGPGESRALTATVADQLGRPMAQPQIEWLSRDPAVATVSAAGSVSGQAPGSTQVVGRIGSVVDSVLVRVTAAAPTSDDALAAARSCVALVESEDAGGLRTLMTDTQARSHGEFLRVVENGRLTPNGPVAGLTVDGTRASFGLPVRHRTGFGANREGTMRFEIELARQGQAWSLAACSPAADAELP
ncbi:MAG: protein kinase [Gemmatimonadetes bacterium]|nr:protein kinase [Gemmatimonadota bacterium]